MTHQTLRALCLAAFLAAPVRVLAQEAPSPAPAPAPVWGELQNDNPLALPPPLPALPLPSFPSAVADVQDAATAPANTEPSAPVAPLVGKSPRKALRWALSGPIAGLSACAATIGTAVVINATNTPSQNVFLTTACLVVPLLSANAGHVYAGEGRHAAQRTARRIFWIAAPTLAGFALGYTRIATDRLGEFAPLGTGAAGLVAGIGTSTVLAIREIIDAPKAARRYNQKHSLSEPSTPEGTAELSADASNTASAKSPSEHPALRLNP